MSLFLRTPRTRQPQELAGLSDAYLDGSVIGLNFGASINANLAQYLHNRLIPRASDGVKISKDGRGIYCTDTTRSLLDNDFGAPMVTSDGAGTGDFSIAGVISPKSAATRSPVLHMRYNTAAPFTSLFVLVNGYYQDNLTSGSNEAGTLYIGSFHGVTNYNARGLKVTGIVNGQTLNFVYNRYTSGYQELWVNGALVSSGTTVVNPVLAPGTQQFAIGGFAQAAGFPYVDPTNLIYVSNKAIDGAAVSANPWQILEPQSRSLWIPGAVPAVPHSVTTASSSQGNASSIGAISQTHNIAVTSSAQSNVSTTTEIQQTHLIGVRISSQANASSAGAVTQGAQITVASSAQATTSTTASIGQMHLVSAASASQVNASSPVAVSQDGTAFITAASSTQYSVTSPVAVQQTHLIVCAASVQDNIAAASIIVQMHLIDASNSSLPNVDSVVDIRQTHFIGVTSSTQPVATSDAIVSQDLSVLLVADAVTQPVTSSPAAITQTHMLVFAPVAVDSVASASTVVQTHLVGVADSIQGNRSSTASASNVAFGTDSGVIFSISGPVRDFNLLPADPVVFSLHPGVGSI